MKRAVAICLASLLMVQTCSFVVNEAFKLGELIEHARLHSREYGDSFLVFLSKHYGNLSQEHSSVHEEHEELPFHHHSGISLTITYLDSGDHNLTLAAPGNDLNITNSVYQESKSEFVIIPIFQPPIFYFS